MQIRINLPAENHPSRKFSANQDAFPRLKSSRPEISSKSGCISPPEIIPPGHFQQIKMHFPNRNHPSRKFPANQDAFLHWESSLLEISNKSGCISPPGIIPARAFLQIRINFPAENHPYKTFPAYQDAFFRRKSSLRKPYLPLKKACPAYETGRVHSERNSMRNHRENE